MFYNIAFSTTDLEPTSFSFFPQTISLIFYAELLCGGAWRKATREN